MAEQRDRYDRIAEGYAAWWAPIHRQGTLGVLEVVEADVAAGARAILDVGTGTGTLALGAVERWPAVRVTGVDASDGMLALAERARDGLPAPAARRLALRQSFADALPFDDGAFDVVVSAFVYQLVPSRPRALREARRVLRPGGRLAYATWLAGGEPFAADDAFDDALEAVGIGAREPFDHAGDVPSPGAAVAQLRRAGFADATATTGRLEHAFTPEGFLAFLARFDEEDLFATLEPERRRALETQLLARLRALPPEGLRMVLPIVYVTGRRPAGRR